MFRTCTCITAIFVLTALLCSGCLYVDHTTMVTPVRTTDRGDAPRHGLNFPQVERRLLAIDCFGFVNTPPAH